MLNEFFIHGSPHLLSCTLRLFNCVFESGYFTEVWTIGLFVPLYKKAACIVLTICVASPY